MNQKKNIPKYLSVIFQNFLQNLKYCVLRILR